MPEQDLERAQVATRFEQVCSEAMAKQVGPDLLRDAGVLCSVTDREVDRFACQGRAIPGEEKILTARLRFGKKKRGPVQD